MERLFYLAKECSTFKEFEALASQHPVPCEGKVLVSFDWYDIRSRELLEVEDFEKLKELNPAIVFHDFGGKHSETIVEFNSMIDKEERALDGYKRDSRVMSSVCLYNGEAYDTPYHLLESFEKEDGTE